MKARIQNFEGFRSTPDNKDGTYTIGYGHTKTARNYIGRTISQNEALQLFEADIKEAENKVRYWATANKIFLFPAQFDALVSFVFNVGHIPKSFTKRIKDLAGPEISELMKQYKFSQGKPQPGLIVRRNVEASIFDRPKFIFATFLGFLILQRLKR